jgi:hypothetical protein
MDASRFARALLVVFSVGCSDDSADSGDTKAKQTSFDALVKKRNACELDGDCTLVGDGCAALCGVSVNITYAVEVKAEAVKLNNAYAEMGTNCNALCNDSEPACSLGHCGVCSK